MLCAKSAGLCKSIPLEDLLPWEVFQVVRDDGTHTAARPLRGSARAVHARARTWRPVDKGQTFRLATRSRLDSSNESNLLRPLALPGDRLNRLLATRRDGSFQLRIKEADVAAARSCEGLIALDVW